jgi:hypothetical protein
MRVAFSVADPLVGCNPPALLGTLASVFVHAGIAVAMGSEKHPKPLARLAYPLPLGVGAQEEWADVTLESGLSETPQAALECLRRHSPGGLGVLGLEQIPHHASPVDELVQAAHWVWQCPPGLRPEAEDRTGAFERAPSFSLTKTGKQDGAKGTKSVEVRRMVLSMAWDGGGLGFSTAVLQGHALNPTKLLSAIMGLGWESLGSLRRTRLDLGEDPRLERHDKYAHKLRNIFEDAVLLESGPGPGLVEDEDDEVLIL